MSVNKHYRRGYERKAPPGWDVFKSEKQAKEDNEAYKRGKADRKRDDENAYRQEQQKKNK